MATKEAKNWYETILDSQKKMAETMNESAKKWTSNDQINSALENGSDFFKKWLDFQMDFAKNANQTGSTKEAEKAIKDNMDKWKSFYEGLFGNQFSSLNEAYKKNMEMFQGMTGNWNPGLWNQAPGMDMMNNWNKSVSEMYKSMMSNFNGNSNMKETFEGLYNHTQSFMKFYEMWSPVMKAMQNKNFDATMLQKMINPETYKTFMDSFFGFMPAGSQDMWNEGMNKMSESMKSYTQQGMDAYKNMTSQFNQYMPNVNSMFTESLNNYNNMYSQMQNAFAPFSKLVTPNSFTQSSEAVSEIMDMMNRYQIQNSQLQYMTYTTGLKAMDEMGLKLAEMTKEGKTFDSMQDMFKAWLNTSDKYFVELFETEEFSKVQAETSSLSLRIKGSVDKQMEKMFANVPLVPRSEMDELYKTVYDLKAKVRGLEKALDNATAKPAATPVAAKEEVVKPVAKKATK